MSAEGMPSADKPSRSLLPPIEAEAREISGSPAVVAGSPVPAIGGLGVLANSAAARPHFDIPPQSHDSPEGYDLHAGADPQRIDAVIQSSGHASAMELLAGKEDGPNFTSLSVAWHMKPPKLPNVHHEAAEERGSPGQHPERPGPDGKAPVDPYGHHDGDLHDQPDQPGDGPSVQVTQTAIVVQDASIIVTGYLGEVVARLYLDQNLVMDQDTDISLALDGDGNFSVAVGQGTHIDQDVAIDLDVLDVDGVLHVDLFLSDSISVDQDTTIDISAGDSEPGGTVDVDQDVVLDQDVDVDIDIEDELQERYAVTIKVDVVQIADVDQYAGVDIMDCDGQVGMDVDAMQSAIVEQETVVRADFALI